MKYYTYVLLDDGVPFYVGKGSGKRMYLHEVRARAGHVPNRKNRHLLYKIAKILRENRDIKYVKVFESDNPKDCLEKEIEVIKDFLDQGISLCNKSPGGEGLRGSEHCKHSAETKLKMSEMKKQFYADNPEALEKAKQAMLRARAICTAKNGWKGKVVSEETRKKHTEDMKRRYAENPELGKKRNLDMKEGTLREAERRRGKRLEEIFPDLEKQAQIREKLSQAGKRGGEHSTRTKKGRTYEEIYGLEKAAEIRAKLRAAKKEKKQTEAK